MSAPKTNIDINSLVRKNVLSMKPYSSARDEFKGEAEVFLDANENPYPSPFNRYPDPLQWPLKEKIAEMKNILPRQIFLGNGSDEAIDLLIRAFCEPHRDSILITEPTYGMYAVCAEVNAVNIQRMLLTTGFDIDMAAYHSAVDATTKIVFLCSPNNPTANLLSRDKITGIASTFNGLVVVDEAYIDFADSEGFAGALLQYPNLVILQTFSKAWGLAGLRLGMCVADEAIIRILNKIKYPYNVNIRTQELALEALSNQEVKQAWVNEILAERETLAAALTSLPIVERVFPSDANFLLVRFQDAPGVYKKLMAKNIIVRDRSRVALCFNCIRITIGTPEENKKLINALNEL